jgi:putative component of toxin-antitoxin plasmid stabilization module
MFETEKTEEFDQWLSELADQVAKETSFRALNALASAIPAM